MKNNKVIIGVIVAIVVVAGIFLLAQNSSKKIAPEPMTDLPDQVESSDVPQTGANPTQTPATKSSVISPEVRDKIRTDFISSCQVKAKASVSVCTCAADYLGNNYTDTELEKIYLQYHSSNQVPSAIMTAVEQACSGK